jgi:fatty acid synthase subunit alpha
MKYHIDNVDASQGPTYEKAKKFGQMLLDNCTPTVSGRELMYRS